MTRHRGPYQYKPRPGTELGAKILFWVIVVSLVLGGMDKLIELIKAWW
jgi:hypothetical protein